MATKNFMSMVTVVAVGKVLEEHMTKVEGGFGVYKDGFDDARIATMVTTASAPVNATNVGNLRRDMFGNFPPASRAFDAVAKILVDLDAKVKALEGRIVSIELRLRPKDPLGDKNFPTGQGNPARLK